MIALDRCTTFLEIARLTGTPVNILAGVLGSHFESNPDKERFERIVAELDFATKINSGGAIYSYFSHPKSGNFSSLRYVPRMELYSQNGFGELCLELSEFYRDLVGVQLFSDDLNERFAKCHDFSARKSTVLYFDVTLEKNLETCNRASQSGDMVNLPQRSVNDFLGQLDLALADPLVVGLAKGLALTSSLYHRNEHRIASRDQIRSMAFTPQFASGGTRVDSVQVGKYWYEGQVTLEGCNGEPSWNDRAFFGHLNARNIAHFAVVPKDMLGS